MSQPRTTYKGHGDARSVLSHLKRGEAVALFIDKEMDDALDVTTIWATLSSRAIARMLHHLGF